LTEAGVSSTNTKRFHDPPSEGEIRPTPRQWIHGAIQN
jgi:hypothetical protein